MTVQPTKSDEEQAADPWRVLILRIVKRDQSALGDLRHACLTRIHTVAKRILGDTEDTEEVIYDVLLWVWHHPERHDPERGSVSAWLNNLTWSRAIDRLRKRRRQQDILHPEVADEAYPVATVEPETWLSMVDCGSRVHRAMATLTSAQRELVLLAFFEGLSHQEIADRVARPLGTVKSLIRRGILQMRSVLEESEARERN